MRRALLPLVVILAICGVAACSDVANGSQPSGASKASGSSRPADAGTSGLETVNIQVDGLTRTYLLYVPPGDSTTNRLPLVLVYHGAGDTASNTTNEMGLLALAEQRHNMIIVYLQGVDDTWNDDAGDPPAEQQNVNDIGFTKAVLNKVESRYYVNRSRVVATGISNGAILVELLGCRIASDLTLIAPVEGQIANRFANNCKPGRPVSVYEVHATADPEIPYKGGTFGGDGGPVTVLSATASAKRWATLDHCVRRGSLTRSGSLIMRYQKCRDDVTVTLNSVLGGSHEWPDGFASTLLSAIDRLPADREAVTPSQW